MIQQYPYVALYRALLAKQLKEGKHDDFQEALKKAALYSTNRKRLYHYINVDVKPIEQKKPLVEEVVKAPPKIVEETVKAEITIVEEKVIDDTIEATNNIKEVMEEVTLPPTEKVEETTIEVVKEKEVVKKTDEVVSHKASEEVVGEHSFVEWLEFLEDEVVFDHQESELQEEIERHEAAVIYEAELNEEINKSIEAEEVVTPDLSDEEHKKVNQLAQGSITLTTGLVTETLAKIMLMQGKINDAIAMYKALSLKYPEKSNYFAAQIEKIKNS
ncbi:MAG: hypothetical protein R2728_15880 [Chitinophagales bacterium]